MARVQSTTEYTMWLSCASDDDTKKQLAYLDTCRAIPCTFGMLNRLFKSLVLHTGLSISILDNEPSSDRQMEFTDGVHRSNCHLFRTVYLARTYLFAITGFMETNSYGLRMRPVYEQHTEPKRFIGDAMCAILVSEFIRVNLFSRADAFTDASAGSLSSRTNLFRFEQLCACAAQLVAVAEVLRGELSTKTVPDRAIVDELDASVLYCLATLHGLAVFERTSCLEPVSLVFWLTCARKIRMELIALRCLSDYDGPGAVTAFCMAIHSNPATAGKLKSDSLIAKISFIRTLKDQGLSEEATLARRWEDAAIVEEAEEGASRVLFNANCASSFEGFDMLDLPGFLAAQGSAASEAPARGAGKALVSAKWFPPFHFRKGGRAGDRAPAQAPPAGHHG